MTERTGRALVWAVVLLTITVDSSLPADNSRPAWAALGDILIWCGIWFAVCFNMFDVFDFSHTKKEPS